MSDLEMFAPGEGQGEAMSEEAFEKFKEQMKSTAAAAQKAQKDEAKRKKKENRLTQILLRFFEDPKKKDTLLLAARVLEQNIPPHFVLSVLVLGNEEFQKEVMVAAEEDKAFAPPQINIEIPYSDNETAVKDIKHWIAGMMLQAATSPAKMKKTMYDENHKIKLLVIQFAAFVMRDYLARHHKIPTYSELKELLETIFSKIMQKVEHAPPIEA